MKKGYLTLLMSFSLRNIFSQDVNIEKISLFDLHPSSERKHENESVWRENYDTLSFPIEKIKCFSVNQNALYRAFNTIQSELKKTKKTKSRSLDIFYLFKIDLKNGTTKYLAFFANYECFYNGNFYKRDKKLYKKLRDYLCRSNS